MKRLKLHLLSAGRRTVSSPCVSPPLGTLSLAAYLRQQLDLDTKIFDQRVEDASADKVVRRAVDFEADVVGISALTPWAYPLNGATRGIRASLPDILLLLGGPHAAASRQDALLNNGADAAVTGKDALASDPPGASRNAPFEPLTMKATQQEVA